MQASQGPYFETNSVISVSTRGLLDQPQVLPESQDSKVIWKIKKEEREEGREEGRMNRREEGQRDREKKINHGELLFNFERVQQYLYCPNQLFQYSICQKELNVFIYPWAYLLSA